MPPSRRHVLAPSKHLMHRLRSLNRAKANSASNIWLDSGRCACSIPPSCHNGVAFGEIGRLSAGGTLASATAGWWGGRSKRSLKCCSSGQRGTHESTTRYLPALKDQEMLRLSMPSPQRGTCGLTDNEKPLRQKLAIANRHLSTAAVSKLSPTCRGAGSFEGEFYGTADSRLVSRSVGSEPTTLFRWQDVDGELRTLPTATSRY